MITLADLKTRSEQAVPILVKHYGLKASAVFLAEAGANYHSYVITCEHGTGDPALVEGRPRCDCTYHPLEGTPMTGGMSGGEEPEWSEDTTLRTLAEHVMWSGRPEAMTDAEWAEALAITGVEPVTEAEIDAWAREDTTPTNIDSLPEQP